MDDEPEEPRPPKRDQLSKTPSWVMLGFVLGAACVLAWPRKPEPRPALTVAPARAPAAVEKPTSPPTVDRALFFENVFAEWSKYAVWENELTEVALFNADTKSFSDHFEVFRSGDRYYFRSISQFTRPRLTHGVPENSPLEFTETPATREQWLKENSAESFRKFVGDPGKKD